MKATRKTNRNDRRFNRARIRERQKVRYSGGAQGYKGAKGVEGRESGVKANQAPRYIDGQEFQWHGRPFTSTSGKRYANGWAYAIIGGGRFRGYVEYNEALQAKGKGQDPEKGVDKGEGEKSEKLETVDNKWKANHAEPSEKEAERLRDYRNTLRREWTKVFRRVADLKDAGRERDAKKLLVAAGNKYIKLAREAYEKWGDGEAFNILNSYDLENGGAAGFKKWLENHLYGVLKSDSNDIRALADKADVKTTEREEEIEKPYREKARRDLQEESWEDSAPDASDSWEEEEEGSTLAPEEAAREIGNESETEETEESEAEEEPAEEETAETVESADDAFAAIRRLSTLGGARIATSAARRRLAEEAVTAFKYLGENENSERLGAKRSPISETKPTRSLSSRGARRRT
ncbi:MAG: hypothetical protein IJM30_05005 [Thermoguttaceae bacterium]|nr:hypothetical protein [Thermoguttaceae bacterium]